ncbi:MAG: type III pantothenate kinase [Puniceicoccaceae bacterium]|nr:MAG: type III pantothenate kinase [Puniceicoccaceae bacterium]
MNHPPLICIDCGNTHTHLGLATGDTLAGKGEVPTPALADPQAGLAATLRGWPELARATTAPAAAFCTVVPAAAPAIRQALEQAFPGCPCWQLTCEADLGLPITYPQPREIGQDRLANAAAAAAAGTLPAVVIDLGTAVTFDILSADRGYEGGIIAPGVAIMHRYLHEQTALLPLLDPAPAPPPEAVGKSTREAMRIGCAIGFAGMIRALLDHVLAEFARRPGSPRPALFTTGGSAHLLESSLPPGIRHDPLLTLRGLAAAWKRNFTPGPVSP